MADSDRSGPDLGAFLRFPFAMAEELVQLPTVMRDLRLLVGDLTKLSARLTQTADRLMQVAEVLDIADFPNMSANIGKAVAELDRTVRNVSQPLDALRRRVPGGARRADNVVEPGPIEAGPIPPASE